MPFFASEPMPPKVTMKNTLLSLLLLLTLCGVVAAQAPAPTPAAAAKQPFQRAAYLWTQAYDLDMSGSAGQGRGDWLAYKGKDWLNLPQLSVEVDPGWGPGDWYDCCQHVNWNAPWAKMQQRYGAALPDVVLSIGQMPADPDTSHSWDQKLAWENATWKAEAANDPTIMGYFANYAKEVNDLGFKSVIIRIGYEFDGGWNPFGNLNVMSDMPGNYIKAWHNIVTAMRKADRGHIIKGFFWNPTDGNVQIDQFAYYPGDDYVDFVGFDEYDFYYNGAYKVGTTQPTQEQQDTAWRDAELPRITRFGDLARAHNKKIIIGEWGLWQLNDKWHPSGGDNPSYIQRMYDWMSDPANRVYMEVYFETPSDGNSQLWPRWGHDTTQYPKAAALYRKLFGNLPKPVAPTAPTGLTATPGYKTAALSWKRAAGEPWPTYNVYRGTKAGGEAVTPVASKLTTLGFTDKGLTNGTAYFYTVKAVNRAGTSGASAEASVAPAVPDNYVQNPGFETGSINAWTQEPGSTDGAGYAENKGNAHAGNWIYTHWSSSPYQSTLSQTMAIANGTHTVSVWVRCSGGQSACQMIAGNGDGTNPKAVSLPASSTWTQVSETVTVTTGTLKVAFHSNASANQWLNMDDVVVK